MLKRSPDQNQRIKYIGALKTGYAQLNAKKSFLAIPTHVYSNDQAFIRPMAIKFDTDKETGKYGSLTVIFSCWNGMVGTGLVTIPWAFSQSGLILGLMLTFLAFTISFTTQYFVMKTAGSDLDYTDSLKRIFGIKGFYIGMFLFIMMLFIPIIIYF